LHHFVFPVIIVLLFGKENKSRRTQYLQLRKLTTQIQKDATTKYGKMNSEPVLCSDMNYLLS